MALKSFLSLVTPATGTNEQTAVHQITVTASGTSREYPEMASFHRGIFFLDVVAFTGAPTFAIALEIEDPLTRKWHRVRKADGTTDFGWTGISATGTKDPIMTELYGLNYRLVWTLTGGTTPSVTFSCCVVMGSEEPVV